MDVQITVEGGGHGRVPLDCVGHLCSWHGWLFVCVVDRRFWGLFLPASLMGACRDAAEQRSWVCERGVDIVQRGV